MMYTRSIDGIIHELGTYSELTVSMLQQVALDYRESHDKWDIVDGITAVIGGKESAIGTQFDERVLEALSFTPDPFAPY